MLKILVLEHPTIVPVITRYLKYLAEATGHVFQAIFAADVSDAKNHLFEADMAIVYLFGEAEEQLLDDILSNHIPAVATTVRPIKSRFRNRKDLQFLHKFDFDLHILRAAICGFAEIAIKRKVVAAKQALFEVLLKGQDPIRN